MSLSWARHRLSLDRLADAPAWLAPALVAVVSWVGGVHQVGPLSVYLEPRFLPLRWYVLEQGLSVAVTVAALGGATALVGSRVLPLRAALAAACAARFPLALAAALASRAAFQSFLPARLVEMSGHGLRLTLSPLQAAWLAVVTLALAGLMLRAALIYAGALGWALPSSGRVVAAVLLTLVLGEISGRLLEGRLLMFFTWPP
jgi:hypothetical protein